LDVAERMVSRGVLGKPVKLIGAAWMRDPQASPQKSIVSGPETLGRMGIISAGTTSHLAANKEQLGIDSLRDLPGPPNPVDYGLLPFISFCNRISRPAQRTARFDILGNIKDQADFITAINAMIDGNLDLIVWWSFAVARTGQDADTEAAIEKAVRRGVAGRATFVYPCFSGPEISSPRVIAVGGVVCQPPYLVVSPAPAAYPLTPPKIVTWGGWHGFRLAWRVAGFTDIGLPEHDPRMNEHSLATWSIAACLALALNQSAVGQARDDPDLYLRRLSVAVQLHPDGLRPVLGHFEPRLVGEWGGRQ
jgi:hypothetical protein